MVPWDHSCRVHRPLGSAVADGAVFCVLKSGEERKTTGKAYICRYIWISSEKGKSIYL